mmetsp:Transcript_14053/g.59195  ORF Transcript_14053/g.59195 Transcript_14053/m.59195 type:complete len:207 (+) Transcript_14053:1950-2570(+)
MTFTRRIASLNCSRFNTSPARRRPPCGCMPATKRIAAARDDVRVSSAARIASSTASTVSSEGNASLAKCSLGYSNRGVTLFSLTTPCFDARARSCSFLEMAARSGDASAASSAGASPLNPSPRAGDSGVIPFGERGDMGTKGSSSPGTSMRRFPNPPMPLCESRPGESNDDFAGGEPTNSNSSSFSRRASLRPGDPTKSPPPAGLS